MAERLGICVSTRDKFHHVIGIAKAAHAQNKKVEIFFTGEGVHCTQADNFAQILQGSESGDMRSELHCQRV